MTMLYIVGSGILCRIQIKRKKECNMSHLGSKRHFLGQEMGTNIAEVKQTFIHVAYRNNIR